MGFSGIVIEKGPVHTGNALEPHCFGLPCQKHCRCKIVVNFINPFRRIEPHLV